MDTDDQEIAAASNVSTPITTPSPQKSSDPTQLYVTDLDHYIPVGTLVFRHVCLYGYESWRDVRTENLLPGQPLREFLGDPIIRLYEEQWVRLRVKSSNAENGVAHVQVFVLPEDVAKRTITNRNNIQLRKCLQKMLNRLHSEDDESSGPVFEPLATRIDHSLWFLFNFLPSPRPDPSRAQSTFDRAAMEMLLSDGFRLPGLISSLYPFQSRTAAYMVERETQPEKYLDPRFEQRTDLRGNTYYYSPKDHEFRRDLLSYETPRGGILAESMGHGKTLISLAVILATRNHLPRFPVAYAPQPKLAGPTSSLLHMAAACVVRHSLPWRNFELSPPCAKEMASMLPIYEIPPERVRTNRNFTKLPSRHLILSSGTLVIVPPNLFDQWQSEIRKHVEDGFLRVLCLDLRSSIPTARQLATYDIVLCSTSRFRNESIDGQDQHGRRILQGPQPRCNCPYIGATRIPDCTCLKPEDIYASPLKALHWLRIIVDEGHKFASKGSVAVRFANELEAERRWVVSGTPAKGLVGVDIDETSMDPVDDFTAAEVRQSLMDQRREFSGAKEEEESAKALGHLAAGFLQVQPWAKSHEKPANWADYIFAQKKTKTDGFTGYTSCLSRTINHLIIKTRPEDVESDLTLPPMRHKVKYLEPCFYDKMTSNMFIQVMRGNAITSERTDRDYLFHKHNEKHRNELIKNLRQANFAWTGFSAADVESSLDVCTQYLEKEGTLCTPEDRTALVESMNTIGRLREIAAWNAMSQTHEIGLFVESFPKDFADIWALDATDSPPMFGLERLYHAQIHVNGQKNPLDGFNAAAITARSRVLPAVEPAKRTSASGQAEKELSGVPPSSLNGETGGLARMAARRIPIKLKPAKSVKHRRHSSETANGAPSAKKAKIVKLPVRFDPSKTTKQAQLVAEARLEPAASQSSGEPAKPPPFEDLSSVSSKSARFAGISDVAMETAPSSLAVRTERPSHVDFPKTGPRSILKSSMKTTTAPDPLSDPEALQANLSAIQNTTLLGTTSAKASYLIDKFSTHCATEKMLVFFDCVTTARCIQNILDVLHIQSRHFAPGMSPAQQSANKTAFQEDPSIRVLLIDVKLGGEGLDLNAASIVLIVNPICQPALEAQAIKRAHRIGQTKPVTVETLVLRGTIEEQMLERAKRMTRAEVSAGMARSEGIKEILLNAQILPVADDEAMARNAMARLQFPQKVFRREGYEKFAQDDEEEKGHPAKGKRKKGKGKATELGARSGDVPEHADSAAAYDVAMSVDHDTLVPLQPELRTASSSLTASTMRPASPAGFKSIFGDPS